MSELPIVAVVPAAGVGSRMQADRPKQYLTIGHQTILEHTLLALHSHPAVSRVVVAVSENDPYFFELEVAAAPWLTHVVGGSTRAESVMNALQTLNDNTWALVHDAARPCVSHADITKLITVTQDDQVAGGILATQVRDTMKRATPLEPDLISHTESRENLWHALTPQLFNARELQDAISLAKRDGVDVTDEASAMEHAGYIVKLIDSNPANIKITRPADLPLATFYLQQTQR